MENDIKTMSKPTPPPADKIHVIYVQPMEPAREIMIDNTLSGMQELVGGHLEVVRPFEDDAVLLCNEDGKISGLEPNRSLRDRNGKVRDVIRGSFFIVREEPGADHFTDLSPAQIRKFLTQFRIPEYIVEVQTGRRTIFRDLT